MKQLLPYLMFSGNCREALHFYAASLEGEITHLQTVGDSPLAAPAEHQDRIFDAEFQADHIRFKASDDMPSQLTAAGTNFAMFLTFSDSTQQKQTFARLSVGGQIQFPLENGFGMLLDQFGIQWMLAYEN